MFCNDDSFRAGKTGEGIRRKMFGYFSADSIKTCAAGKAPYGRVRSYTQSLQLRHDAIPNGCHRPCSIQRLIEKDAALRCPSVGTKYLIKFSSISLLEWFVSVNDGRIIPSFCVSRRFPFFSDHNDKFPTVSL